MYLEIIINLFDLPIVRLALILFNLLPLLNIL